MNSGSQKTKNYPKIGLALGSGSAKGWAHIGVIQALNEAEINVDYIAGTSIGALVGAFYAAGKIDTIKQTALRLDWKQILSFFDVVFPKSGLIDGKRITDFIRKEIKESNIDISEFHIPFCAVSTDLKSGHEVLISEGSIVDAIRASISIPGIFTPVFKNDGILVDGGLVNPVPVSVARKMGADFIIAVDLNHDITDQKSDTKTNKSKSDNMADDSGKKKSFVEKNTFLDTINKKIKTFEQSIKPQIDQWKMKDPVPNIFEVLMSSITITEKQITETNLKTDPPDILIQPYLGHIQLLEFHRAEEAIAEGYSKTKEMIQPLLEKDGILSH